MDIALLGSFDRRLIEGPLRPSFVSVCSPSFHSFSFLRFLKVTCYNLRHHTCFATLAIYGH